jgi:hypothetical protein
MASEKQMEFFKYLFDLESERRKLLRATATTYLTLSTFYSAFVFFVAEKLRPIEFLPKLLFAAAVVSMIVAFVLSLWVIQVSSLYVPTRPNAVIGQYGEHPPSDADFFDNRIIDFSVAYNANSPLNDRKARTLAAAGGSMLAGLIFHALFFLDWLYNSGGFNAVKH